MRYIIDVENAHAPAWGSRLATAQRQGELTVLEKGDPTVLLQERVKLVRDALQALRKAGYSEEVMMAFLRIKTGAPITTIDAILRGQREFFEQVGAARV